MVRRTLVIVACLAGLLTPLQASAAWAVRGISSNNGITSTCAVTHTNLKHNAGDLLWFGVSVRDSATATVVSVVDGVNSYTQRRRNATNGQFVEIWTAISASTVNITITVTFSTTVTSQCIVAGFSGTPATIQTPATCQNDGFATAATLHPAGSVTAENGDLMTTITSLISGFVATPNANYSALISDARVYSQWAAPTGTLTSDGAWTSTLARDSVSEQVIIRDGGGSATCAVAGSSTPHGLMMRGAGE